jgi:hypothetical protein
VKNKVLDDCTMTLNSIRPDRWIFFGAVLALVAGFHPPHLVHKNPGSVVVFAVDQSKFRTCEQTSFCRRHRNGHSERLYKYQIDVSSVQFHLPNEEYDDEGSSVENKNTDKAAADADSSSSGIWRSLQEKLLGSKSSSDDQGRGLADKKDPYVRGPPPTLSGQLINTATETSTGNKHGERLDFTIHAMEDGLVRLRVTEVYEDPTVAKRANNNPHSKARVTYDELVLTDVDDVKPAEHALFVKPGDHYLTDKLGMSPSDAQKYMGLQYGDSKDSKNGMFLLLRIDSFAAYLYREADIATGPVIVMGDKGQTHFEIRRHRNDDGEEDGNDSLDGSDSEQKAESDSDEKKEEDGKPEKEIVGYWEVSSCGDFCLSYHF